VETVAPSVNPPSFQSMPAQPAGSKVAMSLPYQPEVVPQTSLATGQLILTLTNSGSASVHFAIYANFAQTNLPCQLDANTDQAITNFLAVSPVDTNSYDYTCYGANGFQRRFAGGLSNDANQIEAWSVIDTNAGTICLLTQDIGTNDVQFLLTDNYGLGGPWTNDLSSGGTATNFYPAIQLNNGWYDLTVTASSDPAFLRHLTGHIENGSTSYSEPSAAPLLSMATTQVVNGIGVSALLANIVPAPSTNPPPLFATTAGQNLILVYPAWASNYVVQASPVFGPGNWSPLSATMNVVSNYAVVSTPMTSTNAFFRLQQ
jgi:hypothetical protein